MPLLRSILLISVFLFCQGVAASAQEADPKVLEKLDFANGLFGRGLYDLALEEYTNFAAQHPESEFMPEAAFGIAESRFFKDDLSGALAAYRHFLTLDTSSNRAAVARLRLGQILFAQQKFHEAADEFAKVEIEKLAKEELRQGYHFYLGRNSAALGANEKALVELQKAAGFEKSFPYTAQSQLFLGDLYVKLGQSAQALTAYQHASQNSSDEQIRIWATFKEGEAKFAAGEYDEAIRIFEQFISAYPAHQLKKEAVINLMSAHFNKGDFEAVQTTFNTTFGLDAQPPENFQPYYILSNAHLRQFEMAQALAVLDQGLSRPGISEADKRIGLAKKAEILIKMKEYQKALDIIRNQLASLGAGSDEILFFEAESYYGLNQFHAALSTYENILKEFPDSAFQDEAKWGAALTLKALGKLDESLAMMSQFYEASDRPTLKENALYNSFLIQVQQEKAAEALVLSEKYRAEFPAGGHYEKVLYVTGNLLTGAGKYDEAIGIYQQYLKDFPQSERQQEVQFLLAYNQQSAGKPQDAVQTYQGIVPVGKDNKFVYSALKNSAGIHIQQGDAASAFAVIKRIQDEFEENDLAVATFIWVAQRFVDEKKYDLALEVISRVPWEQASDKEKSALAYFRAESHLGLKQHQQAMEQFEAAMTGAADGEFAKAAQVGRAEVLKEMQRFDEAGDQLEALVEGNPTDHTVSIHARYNLGELEELQGNLEAAVKYYLLVAVLYDDEQLVPQALYKAGTLLEKQQKTDEALQAYDELVRRYENNDLAQKANERIEALKTR